MTSKSHFSLYSDVFVDHVSRNVIQNVFVEASNVSYFDSVRSNWDTYATPYHPF